MDRKCLMSIREKPNMLVIWYLTYQYVRHVLGEMLLSDRVYQVVRAGLLEEWGVIDHAMLKLLSFDDVTVDILFSTSEADYPEHLSTCAKLYLKEHQLRRAL